MSLYFEGWGAYFQGWGSSFPAQYSGLRAFYQSAAHDLCLVAAADAPTGDVPMIRKGNTTYAVYLVATTDPDASPIRIKTAEGVKAIRRKT